MPVQFRSSAYLLFHHSLLVQTLSALSKYIFLRRQVVHACMETESLLSLLQISSLLVEVSDVKSRLAAKEAELAKLQTTITQKDEQLAAIRADFDAQSAKLSEAGSVMSQITSLSQALVDAAGGLGVNVDESSVLAQTNYELFRTNRALLEREMELQKMQVRMGPGEGVVHSALRSWVSLAQLKASRSALSRSKQEAKECYEQKNVRRLNAGVSQGRLPSQGAAAETISSERGRIGGVCVGAEGVPFSLSFRK